MDSDSMIVTSTIYSLQKPGEYSEKYSYSRYGNPSRDALEKSLAELEKAKFAVAFSSKIAASLALLSSLQANDRAIFSNKTSFLQLKNLCVHLNVEFMDLKDVEVFAKSCGSDIQMVWIETPSNPLMTVIDIESIVEVTHANSRAVVVVDNTLLTPYFQKPLEFGADAVIYSLDEFISGHSDVNMGAVTTNNEKLHEKLRYHQYASGMVPSPFDCYIVQRSLKTLPVRMESHSNNSFEIANFLESHSKIDKVFHPALKLHKNHEVALKQSSGHPGIMSFYIKGSLEESNKFLTFLQMISMAESVGGVETSISIECNPDLSQNLIKLSVGLENVVELIADLNQAITKTFF